MHTADALIRSVLHMDPVLLSDAEWAAQVRMAEWAENYRLNRLAKMFNGE